MVHYETLRNHFHTNRAWQGSQALKKVKIYSVDNRSWYGSHLLVNHTKNQVLMTFFFFFFFLQTDTSKYTISPISRQIKMSYIIPFVNWMCYNRSCLQTLVFCGLAAQSIKDIIDLTSDIQTNFCKIRPCQNRSNLFRSI